MRRSRRAVVVIVLTTLALALDACGGSPAESQGQRAVDEALRGVPVVSAPGPAAYGRFTAAAARGWTDPRRFPVGTWLSSIQSRDDIDTDRAIGINTYFELTENSDLSLLRNSDMSTVLGEPFTRTSPVAAGQLLGDEIDMKAGPGRAAAAPGQEQGASPCAVPDSKCGYTVLDQVRNQATAPGQFRWANYGKGVMFWESDAEAAGFVNGFTDVVSTDIYWYSDPNVCDEGQRFRGIDPSRCRRAANYGQVIDRERALDAQDGRAQPILAFVETGNPFETGSTATAPQVAGAVMNSVIHGASGVVYFDHNFGGSCRSEHALRDCDPATRSTVAQVNQELQTLAPALNGPTYTLPLGGGLDSTVKAADGSVYVIAMISANTDPGTRTLTLPPSMRGWSITAPFENRTITRSSADSFTETFAQESTYHVYRLQPS